MDLGWKAVGWNLDVKESPASKPAGETPLLVAISLHQHLWAWFTTQFPFYFIITVWQGYVSNNQLRSWQLLPSVDWRVKGFLCVVRVCRQTMSHSNRNCVRVFPFRIQSPHTSHWLCSKHWTEATSFFGCSTQLAHSIGFVIVWWKVQIQGKHGWYIPSLICVYGHGGHCPVESQRGEGGGKKEKKGEKEHLSVGPRLWA